MSARRPATGADRSPLIRQAMLAGPKKPSSAGWSGIALTRAAADRSTRAAASAYSFIPATLPRTIGAARRPRPSSPPQSVSAQMLAAGRRGPVEQWAVRHDAGWVQARVGAVVVPLDLVEPGGVAEGGQRVQVARVRPQVRVVADPAQVALEVRVVDRIEPRERHPQPHVRLGELVADQEALSGKPLLEIIQRLKQARHRLVVALLRGREPGPVDAIVDGGVYQLVDLVDLRPQPLWVQLVGRAGPPRELRVQVQRDVREVVTDDPASLLVPQHRYRNVPVVAGLGCLISLAEQGEAVYWVEAVAVTFAERPATAVTHRVHCGQRDDLLQSEQFAHDGAAVRPRTRPADVEVVPAWLGAVAA